MSRFIMSDTSKLSAVKTEIHKLRPRDVYCVYAYAEDDSMPWGLYCEHGACMRPPEFALIISVSRSGISFPVAFLCHKHVPDQIQKTNKFKLAAFAARAKRTGG